MFDGIVKIEDTNPLMGGDFSDVGERSAVPASAAAK
jgi:hypothetical protein